MPPTKVRPGVTTSVAPSTLHTFHRNPRRGDTAAIASSLRRHTQYKPITVNIGTHTGRPNEVLAGNHTLMAVRDLAETHPEEAAWQSILAHWIDVDDDMCNRIVVADNQTSTLGGFDTDELVGLLNDFGDDIEGLGFSETDIQALIEMNDGAPDLDDLADKHGDPLDDDFNETVRLRVPPEVATRWKGFREEYDDDGVALVALLNCYVAP
jgi:hypothetical protein